MDVDMGRRRQEEPSGMKEKRPRSQGDAAGLRLSQQLSQNQLVAREEKINMSALDVPKWTMECPGKERFCGRAQGPQLDPPAGGG